MSTFDLSTFLFARPSFLGGAASAFDFGGTLPEFNRALTPEQADRIALTMDMRAIGEDLRQVMEQFAREHNLPVPDAASR